MNTLTITRPDDMHLHLRDGKALTSIVGASSMQFQRAIVMPNLKPPVTSVDMAHDYRQRILLGLSEDSSFEPLMTLYLTDNTSVEEVEKVAESDYVHAIKYYPAGATTNSESGVTNIENVYSVLEAMTEKDIPLLMHGEVADADVDIFDKELVFIETVLLPLTERFPGLRIVFEHITTGTAVEAIMDGPGTLAATITPHHLLYNRNSIFEGGIRPHYYCLPVLKRERSRLSLLEAATSGHPRFFLGTDSAPHAMSQKESSCGCAGIYSAPAAIEIYAEIFDEYGQLDQLEAFASFNGADFYGLPRNTSTITLKKQEWQIPDSLPFADEEIVPLKAGEKCQWQIAEDE
jgi:dihydroorotase